jgi:hypothetical protein
MAQALFSQQPDNIKAKGLTKLKKKLGPKVQLALYALKTFKTAF